MNNGLFKRMIVGYQPCPYLRVWGNGADVKRMMRNTTTKTKLSIEKGRMLLDRRTVAERMTLPLLRSFLLKEPGFASESNVCVWGAQCKVRACVHSLQASSSSSSSSSTSFLCFLVLWAQQQQHQFLFNLILFPPALCLYFLLLCLYWPLLKKIRPNSTSTRANQVLYTHKHTRVQVYTVLITHWLDYFSLYAIYIFPARHQRSKAEEEARALAFIIFFVFFVFFFWLTFIQSCRPCVNKSGSKEGS